MKKLLVFAACGAVSAAALAATVTLNGETEYSVAANTTNTVSDTLTGSGSIRKTGTGSLVLSGTGNDFTGGVVVEAGTVQANAAEAFGTGTITVPNRDAKACFNVAPATSGGYTLFPNALFFTGSSDVGLSGTQGDGRYNVIFYQNTHLTNTISGTRSFRLRHNPKNTSTSPKNGGASTIFDGPLSVATGKTIYLNVYGSMIINGPITASTLFGGEAWSGGGHLYLNNPANDISQMVIALNRTHCGDTNVLRGAEIVWRSPGGASDDLAYLDLDGHDQTIAALRRWTFSASSGWTSYLRDSGNFYCVKTADSKPATLTITGLGTDCTSYETLRGPVSLVLDAQNHPGFKQTFANHASPFTGATTVRAGTLELIEAARFTAMPSLTVESGGTFVTASTNSLPSLEKVTNLVVRGTFDASTAYVNPFGVTLANLEIGAGATLKMPAGSQLFTTSLTMGGQTFTSGRFTAETLATLSGATIADVTVLVVGNAAEVAWTGAVSEALTTLGNWDPAPAASDFSYGLMSPLFASAGVRAIIDADVAFSGMTFCAAEGQAGFTLARDAAENAHGLTLYGGRVAACSNDAALTEHTYVIDAPVALEGPVTFHADKNQTLILSNAFCDTALGNGDRMLTIDGTGISAHTNFGRVVFAGTNYFGGPIVSTTSLWRVSGKLANPGDAYTGNPLNDTSAAILLRFGSAGFTSSSDSYGIELDNAKIGKSIMVNNVMGVRTLTALANTTNEISGFLCYNPATSNHQGVAINSNAEIILSGGLYASHSFRIYKGGTLRIRDKPVTCLCSAGFNPSSGTAIFEVPGNTFAYMLVGYNNQNATVEMKVNHVMTNGVIEVAGDGGSAGQAKDTTGGTQTLDLHCTTQRCAYVAVRKRGVLKGEYPAMLEVYEGRPNILSKANYVIIGKVEGGVGFNLCGPGDLVFTNQAFTSCGDLVVSKGKMEFVSNATWLNGTNVTVTGEGCLKLAAGARFDGKKAVLHLGADADTWQIDIPAGQMQVFNYAYDADGKLLPSGDYGNVASGATRTRYADHFPNNGIIHIRRHGTQFLIR